MELFTIIIAALTGLITSLAIEKYKNFNEQRKLKEEHKQNKLVNLRAFFTSENDGKLTPIARVIISSPCQVIAIKEIPSNATKITSFKQIDLFSQLANEDRKMFASPPKARRRLFRKLPPKTTYKPQQTFYKPLPGDNPEYAWVWSSITNRVEFLGAITTIGRLEQNDIVLVETTVSRQHALVRYENSQFVFYDLTKINPTTVNDEDVYFSTILNDGDIIEIGAFLLEFQQRKPLLSGDK